MNSVTRYLPGPRPSFPGTEAQKREPLSLCELICWVAPEAGVGQSPAHRSPTQETSPAEEKGWLVPGS